MRNVQSPAAGATCELTAASGANHACPTVQIASVAIYDVSSQAGTMRAGVRGPCRFNEVFQRDEQGMPRTWAPSVDIHAGALEARRAAALLLSQLAAVRLGEQPKGAWLCDIPRHLLCRGSMGSVCDSLGNLGTRGPDQGT